MGKKKRKNKQQQEQFYKLQTHEGFESIVRESDKLYVQISRDTFISKPAKEIKPEDIVLGRSALNDITPDDLENILEGNELYYRAKHGIYLTNENEDLIPIFRDRLIRGCAEKDLIPKHNLEKRILREADDFTTAEYDVMRDHIHDEMLKFFGEDSEDVVKPNTVRNWLDGKTTSPSNKNWQLLEALVDHHPTIQTMFNEYQEEIEYSIFDLADTYNYLRREITKELAWEERDQVKKYLNREFGNSENGDDTEFQPTSRKRKSDRKIDITPLLKRVWEYFDKDDTIFVPSTVKGISPSTRKEYLSAKKLETRAGISDKQKRIVTGKAPNINKLKFFELKELYHTHLFFMDIYCVLGLKYLEKDIEEVNLDNIKIHGVIQTSLQNGGLNNPVYATTAGVCDQDEPGTPTKDFGKKLYESSIDGRVDEFFNFKPGTTKKLYNLLYNLTDSHPQNFWDNKLRNEDVYQQQAEIHNWQDAHEDMINEIEQLTEEIDGYMKPTLNIPGARPHHDKKTKKYVKKLIARHKVLAKTLNKRSRKLNKLAQERQELLDSMGHDEDSLYNTPRLVTSLYFNQIATGGIPELKHLNYAHPMLEIFSNDLMMGMVTVALEKKGYTLMTETQAVELLTKYDLGEVQDIIPKMNYIHEHIGKK